MHFIRNEISKNENPADMLTKVAHVAKFKLCLDITGLSNFWMLLDNKERVWVESVDPRWRIVKTDDELKFSVETTMFWSCVYLVSHEIFTCLGYKIEYKQHASLSLQALINSPPWWTHEQFIMSSLRPLSKW